MRLKPPIIGAGGGGGGKGGGGSSSTPVEAPDSLRSRAFARVIDLIGEGEIEGLATGDMRSIYLDQTPIMNDDGTFNFSGVTIATRNGTQGQTYIPGFPDIEAENGVAVQVTNAVPVVRTITSSVYSQARVTLSVPQLSSVDLSNGDTNGSSVEIAIDVQSSGGSYTQVIDDTITGKTTTKYQRSYLIQLTGSAPWNIRVRRLTADSTSDTLQNQTWWDSYTEIVEAKLSYPNSAHMALVIDSQQFSQIPTRGYDMKLLRIQIPSNYDPITRVYTGTWDGTFQIAWSDNAAWVFYDMLSVDRYGLGDFIDASQIDKWALYSIGQYCDELVDDGFGGLEPRFACNIYMQTQAEAFKVMQDMASIFRGMVFWASGLVTAVQDSPSDPMALYANANVIGGLFTYSGSSQKTRHSVALVSWNDPDNFYALTPEYVEDADAIARYGIVTTSVVAVGCTSRGQAHRVGKWLLYSEANETETVTFSAGLDGTVVVPGQIIYVQDADRAGSRLSGRVATATTTHVTLDKTFTPTLGVTYDFYVTLPDGSIGHGVVAGVSGNIVALTAALSATPNPDAIWMVSSTSVALQQFRVINASDTGDGQIQISGLSYNPAKYAAIESGLILTSNPISTLNVPPDAPTSLTLIEGLYSTPQGVKVLVTIAWNQMDRAVSYNLSWQRNNGPINIVNGIRAQIYEIEDALPGLYDITVYGVSVTGKLSSGSPLEMEVYGKTSPPVDVENFTLVNISNGVGQLTWKQAVDLDVLIGGYVRIRYTPDTLSPSWTNAVDLGPALPGSATTASVPLIDGCYMAKFIDSSGNPSVDEAVIETNSASLVGLNIIETIDESAFTGTKTNTLYSAELHGLILDSVTLIDDLGLVDSWDYLDAMGGIQSSGEYDFASTFDLGASFTSLVTIAMGVLAYDVQDLIDSRTDDIDLWPVMDGAVLDDVNAALYVRTTNDDPGASPTWTDWQPFFVGQYVARAYQFKLALTSVLATHNMAVQSLAVTIDMPDRTEAQNGLSTGGISYPVTFPAAFKDTPAIGITALNMQTGDYYQLTAESDTGFTITFYNSSAAIINRNFNYLAKGYGYQQ